MQGRIVSEILSFELLIEREASYVELEMRDSFSQSQSHVLFCIVLGVLVDL